MYKLSLLQLQKRTWRHDYDCEGDLNLESSIEIKNIYDFVSKEMEHLIEISKKLSNSEKSKLALVVQEDVMSVLWDAGYFSSCEEHQEIIMGKTYNKVVDRLNIVLRVISYKYPSIIDQYEDLKEYREMGKI